MKTTKRKKASPAKRPTDDPGGRAQAVYDQLRELIVRGSLAPGSPIIERPFAQQLGVSRGSLRLALRRLEHGGFVSATSAGVYSRAVVTPLTVADMNDIYTLLAALNGVGARQAADLPEPVRRQLADRMEVLNEELSRKLASAGQNFGEVYDIDHQFHQVYLAAVGGARMHMIYDDISLQGERYGRAYSSAVGQMPAVGGLALASPGEHRAIIDAIRAGNAVAAESAAIANWFNAAKRLRWVIMSLGERGNFLSQLE